FVRVIHIEFGDEKEDDMIICYNFAYQKDTKASNKIIIHNTKNLTKNLKLKHKFNKYYLTFLSKYKTKILLKAIYKYLYKYFKAVVFEYGLVEEKGILIKERRLEI
ncbi:hypothetical protein ACJX0J_020338, partial [Zea mays]